MPTRRKLFPCSPEERTIMGPTVLRLLATPFARATRDPAYPTKLQFLSEDLALFAIPAVREYLARAVSDPHRLARGLLRPIDWNHVASIHAPQHIADLVRRIALCPKPIAMPVVLARWFKEWYERELGSELGSELGDVYCYIHLMKALRARERAS